MCLSSVPCTSIVSIWATKAMSQSFGHASQPFLQHKAYVLRIGMQDYIGKYEPLLFDEARASVRTNMQEHTKHAVPVDIVRYQATCSYCCSSRWCM